MFTPNTNGFFDEDTVKNSGLPVYSFDDPEDKYFPMDYWTYSELKDILKITLTSEERKNMIVGFKRSSSRMKGYSALYSMVQVINKRYDMNAKFYGLSDE